MKIIITDNYDRESISDRVLCENINEYWGRILLKYLNDTYSSNTSPNFFKLVSDDYNLYKFKP